MIHQNSLICLRRLASKVIISSFFREASKQERDEGIGGKHLTASPWTIEKRKKKGGERLSFETDFFETERITMQSSDGEKVTVIVIIPRQSHIVAITSRNKKNYFNCRLDLKRRMAENQNKVLFVAPWPPPIQDDAVQFFPHTIMLELKTSCWN